MDAGQVAQLLNQSSDSPEELQAKLDAGNEMLQSDPSAFFIALSEIILSCEDISIVNNALLTLRRPIDIIRNANPDINIFEHFNSISGDIFQNLFEKIFSLVTTVPVKHPACVGACVCIGEVLMADLNELATQMIEALGTLFTESQTLPVATALCDIFESLTNDYLLDPPQYQPILTVLFLVLYDDSKSSTHKNALKSIYNMIDSMGEVIENEENRGKIYELLGSATAKDDLKPICYQIFGQIAFQHYELFSEIAETTVTGAIEYLKSDLSDDDKTAICEFFDCIVNAERDRAKNEEETMGIIGNCIEELFGPLTQIAITFVESESDEALTPQDSALDLVANIAKMLPDDVLPVLTEFIKENIQNEDRGARYASYSFAYIILVLSEEEVFCEFAKEMIPAIAAAIEDPEPRVASASLIALALICSKFIDNNGFAEINDDVKSLIPAMQENFERPTMPQAVCNVISVMSRFESFPEFEELFVYFLQMYGSSEIQLLNPVTQMLCDVIGNMKNLEELAKIVPPFMECFNAIVVPTADEQHAPPVVNEIYYILNILIKREFVEFKPVVPEIVDCIIRRFANYKECESIDAILLSEVVFQTMKTTLDNPFNEQAGLFFEMCAYLMHRFGNPTEMIDGCTATMKFMDAKGMLCESIPEFKDFIIEGITQPATTYESAAAFVRLANYFLSKFPDDSFQGGFIEAIQAINEFVPTIAISDARDTLDLVNEISALYTTLFDKAADAVGQWIDSIIMFIIVYSKVFLSSCESIDEIDTEASLHGITELATLVSGLRPSVELEEDDREPVTRLFHLSSQIENLRMKAFNVCASFSLEQPPLPEDDEE